jgi:lipoprotein-releasing system permease protein
MGMNFLFAWRYFKSKKTTNAINVIAWISVVAIAVGTASLIIILSVFNGFEGLVKNMYGDFYADIKVAPAHGKFMQLPAVQLQKISAVKGVEKISLVTEEKALLVNGDNQSIIYLKGVDSNYSAVSRVSKHIERGVYNLGSVDSPLLIVGIGIENAVQVDPGKTGASLTLYLPNRDAKSFNSIDAMNSFNVFVAGSFSVQEEFDNKYAFTNIGFVQYMLDLNPDEYSAVELSAKDSSTVAEIKKTIQEELGNNFLVQTRFEQNQSLFTVMEVERWVIYAILSLILLIASFNMVGALTMLVLEKQKDIAVLKAMGANNKLVQNIFLSEGFLLAGVGGTAGIILALIVCELQIHFHLVPLEGGSFIIDYYPIKMALFDFILVSFTVFIVAVLAAWIPSRKAAAQSFSLKS